MNWGFFYFKKNLIFISSSSFYWRASKRGTKQKKNMAFMGRDRGSDSTSLPCKIQKQKQEVSSPLIHKGRASNYYSSKLFPPFTKNFFTNQFQKKNNNKPKESSFFLLGSWIKIESWGKKRKKKLNEGNWEMGFDVAGENWSGQSKFSSLVGYLY